MKELFFDEETKNLKTELISLKEVTNDDKNYFAIKIRNGLGEEIKKTIIKEKNRKKKLSYKIKKMINNFLNRF